DWGAMGKERQSIVVGQGGEVSEAGYGVKGSSDGKGNLFQRGDHRIVSEEVHAEITRVFMQCKRDVVIALVQLIPRKRIELSEGHRSQCGLVPWVEVRFLDKQGTLGRFETQLRQ